MGGVVGRVRGMLGDPGLRGVVLVVLAYVGAVASVLSFVFLNDGTEPTRLELLLLMGTVLVVFYVSLTGGG